jgi:hypothetical protein
VVLEAQQVSNVVGSKCKILLYLLIRFTIRFTGVMACRLAVMPIGHSQNMGLDSMTIAL